MEAETIIHANVFEVEAYAGELVSASIFKLGDL